MEMRDRQVLVLQALHSVDQVAFLQSLAGVSRARWAHPSFVGRQVSHAVALEGQAG
jgi:hypothetical protein